MSGHSKVGKFSGVLFLVLVFMLAVPISASWWNSSYDYRKSVNITENSGKTLENHQVKIEINTADLISEGSLQESCEDLRFIGSDDSTRLDYWLESGCNTDSTTVWVEVLEINASSTEEIFLYYGNEEGSSKSSAEQTMYVYDLHGNGYDGSLEGDANYRSNSQEYVELTDASGSETGSIRYSKGTPSPGFYAEWEWYTGDGSGADSNNLIAWNNGNRFEHEDPAQNGIAYALNDHDDCNGINWNSQCGDIASWSENPAKSSWQSAEAYGVREGNTLNYYFNTIGGDLNGTWTNSAFPPGDQFGWSGRTGGSTNHHWVRNLTVRKYTEPNPSVELGEEQTYNLCDSRGPENECILNSTRQISQKNFTVNSVFVADREASVTSTEDFGEIYVSNKSFLSGLWTGNIKLFTDTVVLEAGASFRPENGRIIFSSN